MMGGGGVEEEKKVLADKIIVDLLFAYSFEGSMNTLLQRLKSLWGSFCLGEIPPTGKQRTSSSLWGNTPTEEAVRHSVLVYLE